MASSYSTNNCLPFRWMIALFISFFLAISLYKLPAKFISEGLRSYGIDTREGKGSFWNAHFNDVLVANQFWRDLDVKLQKYPLFLGKIEAEFSAVNENGRLSGIISDVEGDGLTITSVTGTTQINIRQNGRTYPSNITIKSDRLELNNDGLCTVGSFTIETDFLEIFLSRMKLDMPQLEGVGECLGGRVLTSLRSSENGIEVSISGDFSHTVRKGVISLSLSDRLEKNQTIVNELIANGLSKEGSVWQAIMELDI
mgnify:FL=1